MKEIKIFLSGMIALVLIGVGVAFFTGAGSLNLGGVPLKSTFTTAVSTTTDLQVGPEISKTILDAKGGRAYASICNNSASIGWIYFGTTAITATTSASVRVAAGSCYEIDGDNPYTGVVQYMQEASTTNALFTTEFIGS